MGTNSVMEEVELPPKEKEEVWETPEEHSEEEQLCWFLIACQSMTVKKGSRATDFLTVIFEWLIIAGKEADSRITYKNSCGAHLDKHTRRQWYLIQLGRTCKFFRKAVRMHRMAFYHETWALEVKLTKQRYGSDRPVRRKLNRARKRATARRNLLIEILKQCEENHTKEQIEMIRDQEAGVRKDWKQYKLKRTIEIARFPKDHRINCCEVITNFVKMDTNEQGQDIGMNVKFIIELKRSFTVFQLTFGFDQFKEKKSGRFTEDLDHTVQRAFKMGMLGTMFLKDEDAKCNLVQSRSYYRVEGDEVAFYVKL